MLLLLSALVGGCARQRFPKAPGETDITVEPLVFRAEGGGDVGLDTVPVLPRLGLRAGTLLLPDRYYSDFRAAEDRRRLIAYWQTYGYFDVEVHEADVRIDRARSTAHVTWTIKEGPRYPIRALRIVNAPPEFAELLKDDTAFDAGEGAVDLELFRKSRHTMADRLRRAGYGHATVYSRSFVDRKAKAIDWFFYVDAGPKTRVGKVTVVGNHKVPADKVLDRVGMQPGEPYDLETKEKAELDLLDTGAFASAYIETTADTEFIIPGDAPDTGGVMKDEQIDAQGNLVPRKLPEEIDLTVRVVESPSQKLRLGAGFEFDPTRVDVGFGSELWLRHLFGPQHHLVLEGRIGYGWLWRGDTDHPTGLYGEALARSIHPGWIARLIDLRLTTRYRDVLYPGFHLRELTAGPGLRTALARGLFFDIDTFFRWSQDVDFGPFDAATREELSLPEEDTSHGALLELGLVRDARHSQTEPTRGHLLAARVSFSPGEPLGTHRWLSLAPEARGYIPIDQTWSVALRAAPQWVVLDGDEGVPLGPRLFGGGAYGMRGYGRQHLSPSAPCPIEVPFPCSGQLTGGLSLAEGSAELRWLPMRKPYGGVVFGDVGGAGAELNPFDDGVSLAFGIGFRLRLWYLPISLDVSYRLLTRNELEEPSSLDPFGLFLRIGEAF
jgi:outer membrane translocation and assembly module TamA